MWCNYPLAQDATHKPRAKRAASCAALRRVASEFKSLSIGACNPLCFFCFGIVFIPFFWLGFSVFLLNQDTKRGMKGLRQAMTKQFPRQCHQFEPLRVAYLNTLKCPHYATSYVHICFDMHATPQHKATILFILLSPFR